MPQTIKYMHKVCHKPLELEAIEVEEITLAEVFLHEVNTNAGRGGGSRRPIRPEDGHRLLQGGQKSHAQVRQTAP